MVRFLAGFWLGFTLYPFPCLIREPFAGWDRAAFRGYSAGVLCLLAGWFAFFGWLIGR